MKNRRKLQQKLLCCFKCFSPHSIGKLPCKRSTSFRHPTKSNNKVEQESYFPTSLGSIRSQSVTKFRTDSKKGVKKGSTLMSITALSPSYESPMGAEEREESINAAIVYCKSLNEVSSDAER